MSILAASLICMVVGVSDGDTFRARCAGERSAAPVVVRIHAIDAPENGQAFGNPARRALTSLIARQRVRLDCVDTDRYGRRVCQVWHIDPPRQFDVGLNMVEAGLAWWYVRYSDAQTRQDRGRYAAGESQARQRRVGLWHDARPVAPWQWRRAHPRW